jgi:hypothetical protein
MITHPSDIRPDWLTELLISKGYLSTSKVCEIRDKDPSARENSNVYYLDIKYSQTPQELAPSQLFLKTSGPGNDREVEFYNTVAPVMPDPPVPKCYYAEYDQVTKQSSILLEDLSQTHTSWDYPIPPTR